jgi:hypothetical protein
VISVTKGKEQKAEVVWGMEPFPADNSLSS